MLVVPPGHHGFGENVGAGGGRLGDEFARVGGPGDEGLHVAHAVAQMVAVTGGSRRSASAPSDPLPGGNPTPTVVFMAAVGELVRSTSGAWITRPPARCPSGHALGP